MEVEVDVKNEISINIVAMVTMKAAAPVSGTKQWIMCWLISGQALCSCAPRFGLPYLMPFMASDMGLTLEQRAVLLSSFFPGFMLAQIPLGADSFQPLYFAAFFFALLM
eukprot:SAG31_NODE_319_length_17776_cov_4.703570_4_plen_109_part_00